MPSSSRLLISYLDASITVTDISSGTKTNVALPTKLETQIKDAIEDNVDMDVSLDTSSANVVPINEDATGENGGWGGGWGDEGSWDQNAWSQDGAWGDDTQEGQGTNGVANPAPDAGWADANPSWNCDPMSLLSLLGPSAFPLTHTTGIVECSTRRVVSVQYPPGHPHGAAPAPVQDSLASTSTMGEASEGLGWTPSASGVEAELNARFAKVVLEPWGREEGDISGPEIWETSRGPVIDPKKGPQNVATSRKPHNPLADSITLLVVPSFAETLALVPGLGLGGMWIEIASQKRGGRAEGPAEVDVDTPGRFWYHEDVTGIFPSFYTPREKE